jgi:ZIP family zinc transporter
MRSEILTISSGRLLRLALGSILVLAGTGLLIAQGLSWLSLEPRMLRALEGGAICALGTALGAVPVLVMGFGAGIMLAATAFSLIVPGLNAAEGLGYSAWGAGGLISFGILLGAIGLFVVDNFVSRGSNVSPSLEHPEIPSNIWLFVIAIIAHNIPEGMAVGVSAGGGLAHADSLAMGIAIQDVPEGLVIALVLAGAGMSRFKAFMIGAASGLVEPVFAVLCAWLVAIAEMLLPIGLALAAGAMLLVVVHEIIPESRRNGHERIASLGLIAGFCVMMVMDTALG